jgi:hypothetical protein
MIVIATIPDFKKVSTGLGKPYFSDTPRLLFFP